MKNLYIDFDGVILNTIEESYKLLEEAKIDPKCEQKTIEFYRNLDWAYLLKKSDLINDSLNCIKKILESNKFEVSILTHVNSLNEIVEKVKYIRKYFKDITVIPVPKQISKTKMIHTKGAILIDDYIANLKEWEEEGGIPIYFSPTLKQKGYIVINKLDQILEMDI